MNRVHTWLIANWKMNGTRARVLAYAIEWDALLRATPGVQGVFCPPVLFAEPAYAALPADAALAMGAQTCHMLEKGAFTGEISAAMLADSGVGYVILGHSERRAMGETDAQVVAKAQAALAAGITPVVCVGESLAAYQEGGTRTALMAQLQPLQVLDTAAYLIAYEPIWAIGSGLTPTLDEIDAVHGWIKSVLGSAVPVLYGGSVNSANASAILALSEVSGALVGGASLEINSMAAILAAACERKGM